MKEPSSLSFLSNSKFAAGQIPHGFVHIIQNEPVRLHFPIQYTVCNTPDRLQHNFLHKPAALQTAVPGPYRHPSRS